VKRARPALLLLVASAMIVFAGQRISTQSLTYSSGQDVSPAFEGWEQNADGSFNLVFGYMNRNWQEEIDVPVGPDNNIMPGGPDQGQPTHLLPRRNRFMFRVHVPKDFGEKEVVWSLTTHGKVNKAYATLRTDYRIENIDIMSETGALGAGTSNPEIRADKPPVIEVEGMRQLTVKVGQPLTLTATVTDDGVPRSRGGLGGGAAATGAAAAGGGRGGRGGAGADAAPGAAAPVAPPVARGPVVPAPPARITVGKSLGLHAAWFVWRGAGKVTFTPDQIEVWEDTREGANGPWAPRWQNPRPPADGKWVAQATFSEPGTYVLRLRADDGALTTDDDVTVKVTP
jgi:hypothetical protein